ncbi:4-hydroxythreonine-4-phosphate dehydrogenase PdxA [Sedimentisphaera salicampi]|uniref:4-hydroxythreonine-4-phosphate dehydrogenase PdxA n=1 Tax=Sedimentisphaera salicampi TaxID=1941349 RepID=UPI000B9ABBAA|nr:4-hydroxythreonine-4-phosphate dehydrogenase PdxA [Sedimentisphaera salicampi]OXU16174.1 4-hydroxythreonine-4-phosphate dehydrogenase 2 [Sedimentisphaera salicampi]
MLFSNKRIAITMGDLNGIGPEIIVKALYDSVIRLQGRFYIYGSDKYLTKAAGELGIEKFWSVCSPGNFPEKENQVTVFDYGFSIGGGIREPNEDSGRASLLFCSDAISDVFAKKLDALVTAPIHKQSWKMAGAKWPGHTELLTHKTGCKDSAMMFVSSELKVALATIHCALSEVPARLSIKKITNTLELLNQTLVKYFGIERPRIAVAGLNPHAGESGRFGKEESRIIRPAVVASRENGIDADGPSPGDTLFTKESRDKYDGFLAMYHDQGLIPVKTLSMNDATNVTIGLPVIRTSPAHGTAFDIAGKGKADEASMKMAIRVAAMMVDRKRKFQSEK